MPEGKEPLHLGALLKYSQGRWNRQGDYAALYTACTRDGARAEYAKTLRSGGSAGTPRELVSIDVVVSPIYDLTASAAYDALAQRAGVTPHPDFLKRLEKVPFSHCHALADQARSEGYPALLVPSAAAPDEINLVIYVDVVAPRHLELDNGPDREPL